MFRKVAMRLKDFEDQGYPISYIHISSKYMKEFKPYLLETEDENGKPLIKLPINGKEYEVKAAVQMFAGDGYMVGGASDEGIFGMTPNGEEISLLPSFLDVDPNRF